MFSQQEETRFNPFDPKGALDWTVKNVRWCNFGIGATRALDALLCLLTSTPLPIKGRGGTDSRLLVFRTVIDGRAEL